MSAPVAISNRHAEDYARYLNDEVRGGEAYAEELHYGIPRKPKCEMTVNGVAVDLSGPETPPELRAQYAAEGAAIMERIRANALADQEIRRNAHQQTKSAQAA